MYLPKRSHELALERIGCYLKGALDKGLILKPIALEEQQFYIDVFVDAAFARGWDTEQGTDMSQTLHGMVNISRTYLYHSNQMRGSIKINQVSLIS